MYDSIHDEIKPSDIALTNHFLREFGSKQQLDEK
jgi:hypothetical protein